MYPRGIEAHRGNAATVSAAIAANRALTVFAYRIVIRWALFVQSRNTFPHIRISL